MPDTKTLTRGITVPKDFFPDLSVGREYVVAGILSVIWGSALLTYGAGYFNVLGDGDATVRRTFLDLILYSSALCIPLMFLWLGAYMMRHTRVLSEDAAKLKAAVQTMEGAINLSNPATSGDVVSAINEATAKALASEQLRINTQFRNFGEELRQVADAVKVLQKTHAADHQALTHLVETAQDAAEKAQRKAATADHISPKLARMTFEAVNDDVSQDALPIEAPSGIRPGDLDWDNVIRALNFPQDEHDTEGFAAIRKVLPNRDVAQTLQAAEDVLSMLAQEGIYMDDLFVTEANPDLWRAFAKGGRGPDMDGIGTVEDQAALVLARGRMRTDSVFKDVALHFLRQFDRLVQNSIDHATDRDIIHLADTRTGRAFQLMARVSGSFD